MEKHLATAAELRMAFVLALDDGDSMPDEEFEKLAMEATASHYVQQKAELFR